MLSQTAQVEDLDGIRIQGVVWDDTRQYFGLIVKGEVVSLPQMYLDDFTSVLMTVYGGGDPGVSIDPGPTRNENIVRYIGSVRGTRLGRIMFEADRLLKCYSLGRDNLTGKPIDSGIPGFKTMVELFEEHGIRYNGAMYRFWFVPATIRAAQSGNAIVFEDVKIEVKTEYMMTGFKSESEPAAQAFARFFTEHYDEFARIHPELRDLREYAKMVGLAKYLKDRGLPLNWFILAHRTPRTSCPTPTTTPGYTVPEEVTGGLEIWGGVNLSGERCSFVPKWASVRKYVGPVLPAERPSSEIVHPMLKERAVLLAGESVPSLRFGEGEHSCTSVEFPCVIEIEKGRQLVFQTDVVLTGSGPIVELLRYYDAERRDSGEFGSGWHLMMPYEMTLSEDKQQFRGVEIPKTLEIHDLVLDKRETLEFGNDGGGLVGYFPEEARLVQGVHLMSDASYVLSDIKGNCFHFDTGGKLTLVDMGRENRWAYDYRDGRVACIWGLLLGLAADAEEPVKIGNVTLPRAMTVLNRPNSEVLEFGRDSEGAIGYFPATPKRWRALYVRNDGGFRLEDCWNNDYQFDGGGNLVAADVQPTWDFKNGIEPEAIRLAYNAQGHVVAAVVGGEGLVRYAYDDEKLTDCIDVDGLRRTYQYAASGRLLLTTGALETGFAWYWHVLVVVAVAALVGLLFWLHTRRSRCVR